MKDVACLSIKILIIGCLLKGRQGKSPAKSTVFADCINPLLSRPKTKKEVEFGMPIGWGSGTAGTGCPQSGFGS